MTKAKIVGETHSSLKDAAELKGMAESENYDAIFLEGREDKIFDKSRKRSFSYSFFLLGFAEVSALFRFYASKESIKSTADKLGIPIFTTIDAPLPIIFNMTNIWIRRFLFPLIVFFTLVLILWGDLYSRLTGVIILMASPLLHFSVFAMNKKRNDFMANYIVEKINTNNYTNILVGCGNSHVDGIARNLRQAGVEVETIKRRRSRLELLIISILIIAVIIVFMQMIFYFRF